MRSKAQFNKSCYVPYYLDAVSTSRIMRKTGGGNNFAEQLLLSSLVSCRNINAHAKLINMKRCALKYRQGFTIVELLVVIVVIGILAAITVVSYTGITNSAKDSTKMTNIKALDSALRIVSTLEQNLGNPNTVYVSLPDTLATCANLGLPTLPTGWSYACVTAANLTNANGTGWVPVDLSGRISSLPVDDVNQVPNYWTYTTNGTQYHLTSTLSSPSNQLGGSSDKVSNDGGANSSIYEVGTNTSIYPVNGIVINGGFEYVPAFVAAQTSSGRWIDGTVGGSVPKTPYSVYCNFGAAAGDRSAQFDSTQARSGRSSLKIHMSAGAYAECKLNATAYHGINKTSILPNTTYRYSVWMKSENVTGSSTPGQNIVFMFDDASGVGASVTYSGPGGSGTGTSFNTTGNVVTNKAWTQYSGTFTTGANAVWFHPEYRVYSHGGDLTLAGDFWFDDVAVWQQ
jgi:prepilin-type N-terminal cleavage/methylation domain-containing protein